jgi:hypothetical protein
MTESVISREVDRGAAACDPATRVTRSLLGYGVLAGPFYVGVILIQSFFRAGFDIRHDDVSLLANGSLGWIQIANFVITGLMVVACAVGMRRALADGRGSLWAPRLVGIYGLCLIAAGIFVADPMNGFPPGTPAGRPVHMTLHGSLHIAAAGIGFLCLVAACFLLAQRFSAEHRRAWALFSRATGVLFLVGFAGLASGSTSTFAVLGFWVALLLVWGWLAAVSLQLYRAATPNSADLLR